MLYKSSLCTLNSIQFQNFEPELLKKMLNLHENEEDQTQTKISVCACGGKDSRRTDFDQVSF